MRTFPFVARTNHIHIHIHTHTFFGSKKLFWKYQSEILKPKPDRYSENAKIYFATAENILLQKILQKVKEKSKMNAKQRTDREERNDQFGEIQSVLEHRDWSINIVIIKKNVLPCMAVNSSLGSQKKNEILFFSKHNSLRDFCPKHVKVFVKMFTDQLNFFFLSPFSR